MTPLVFSAIIVSITSVIFPGPLAAITVIKGRESPWAGFHIAIGHTLTEIAIIFAIYYGASQFFESEIIQFLLSIVGGIFMIYLGTKMFRVRSTEERWGHGMGYNSFFLGFIATILNPMALLWWATIGGMYIMRFSDFGFYGIVVFILVIEAPNLIWYPFISIITYKTHASTWGQKMQPWILASIGLLLMGFGIWFLVTGIQVVL